MKPLTMKNPSHPGKLIEADLEELGLSVAKAAKGIGVTRQQLYRVISGDCGVTPEMAIRLEKLLAAPLTSGYACNLPMTSHRRVRLLEESKYPV